jgi:hypothetical protein
MVMEIVLGIYAVAVMEVVLGMYALAAYAFGIPTGVAIERVRIYRKAKKRCPEALEELHKNRIL